MTEVINKFTSDIQCAEVLVEIASGKITKCNKDFLSLIGRDPEAEVTEDLYVADYLDGANRQNLKNILNEHISKKEFRGTCYIHRVKRVDGRYAIAIGISKVYGGNIDYAYTTIIDMSEFYEDESTINDKQVGLTGEDSEDAVLSLAAKTKNVENPVVYDVVTGLMNFSSFKPEIASYLQKRDKSRTAAVIYFDINNFTYINDNFGFLAGNQILYDTAKLILSNASIMASTRIHSDLFAAVIEGSSEQALLKKINKIEKVFFVINYQKYPRSDLNISIGVYFLKDDDTNARIAIDNANLARRHIKGARHKNICVFEDVFREQKVAEQKIRSTIHQAIVDGEIEAFLQPKFSCSRMEIIGAEALARWRNPDGTYKQPFVFIPTLENAGYIVDLDFEIFRQVLSLIRNWLDNGIEPVPISVNFSRVHNNYPDFVEKVKKLTEKFGVDPKYIEIEITESIIAKNPETTIKNIAEFAKYGFKVDMDDFGTGYSSLSFLRNAPIDIVKIDKAFVDQVLESPKDKEYVRQLCKLIEFTGKDVLFEGVEKPEQAEFFESCGFDMAQGWLFDKAMPISEFNQKYMKK